MKKYRTYAKLLGVIGLLLLLTGVTYSFFNYTKTGSTNNFSLGSISFSTNQTDNITLTNVFPMSKQEVISDVNYTEKVTIAITGDTTLSKGVEYLVTAEDVSVTVNDKRVPVTIFIDNSEDLGTEDEDYWENRGGNTTIYKPLANSVIVPGQYLLVGYIAPGENGIDGSIDIKGYIDKDKIVISDTFDKTESDEMGTTINWVNDRTVLTTEEWNSLQNEGHELSFKVRIEANEGVWVPEESNPNAINMIDVPNLSSIKEIYFIKETPLRMEKKYDEATYKVDLTYNNEGKVLAWEEGDKLYIASSGETYLTTGYQLFPRFPNLEKIVFENVNTERVLTMQEMFVQLRKLKEVNVEAFDTSNVTNMNSMFLNCNMLENINLSTWDTSNVEDMSSMFFSCSHLESINLDGLGGDNLQSVASMFLYCSQIKDISMKNFNFGTSDLSNSNNPFNGLSIETINLSNADASNVINMPGLFANNSKLKTVNMDGFKFGQNIANMFANLHYLESVSFKNADSSRVTNMQQMFMGSSIESVDLSGLGSSYLTNVSSMFAGCSNLKEVNMTNFNFGTVTTLSNFFASLSNLETVNLNGANTSNVTTMDRLFYNCNKLSTLSLNGLDTSNVENMGFMFYLCKSLTDIDLSHLDTSSVTTMSNIFASSGLVNINISGLGSDNLETITNIFSSCSSLEKVNMSNFNFGLVTKIDYNIFGGFGKLREVDLSGSKMDNINSLSYAFDGSSKIEVLNLSGISNNCGITSFFATFRYTDIKTLDLSGFKTNNVTSVENMFKDCTSLETVYVSSSWDVSNSSGAETFSGCLSLVGGAGTAHSNSNNGYQYARIDGGPSSPGYLTLKTS